MRTLDPARSGAFGGVATPVVLEVAFGDAV